MKPNDNEQLTSLIHLLDDPDEEVYRHVTDKLISFGTEVIPSLEEAWEKSFDPDLHWRLEELIHIIQFETLVKETAEWSRKKSPDILEGAILISKYQYPDLDVFKVHQQLDNLSYEIAREMNYNTTPLEKVNVFNHVLFTLNGFAGNSEKLYDPQNHYLNYVLESKKGNPVSLAILYMILAQKLEMNVYGVKLPQHFVLSLHKNPIDDFRSEQEVRSSFVFYISPFNKGIIFNRDEVSLYLRKMNIDPEAKHFLPSDNRAVIATLVQSLIACYEYGNETEKVNELTRVMEAIER